MDERQAQITEGAGLEDSRINTEFLDFISKWSTPFFVLLLIFAAGMFGYRKLGEMRIAAIDQAYLDYDLATAGGNPSPSTLALLGEDYADVRSVGLMAKLDEADIYLNAARTGIAPGSQPDPLTGDPAAEDVLTPEQIDSYLASAGSAYGVVLASAEQDDKPVFGVSAAFGSAAVLGSQGDTAGARTMYEQAGTIATGAGMPLLAKVAAERAAAIESLPEVTIYTEAELPELPTNDSVLDAINAPGLDIPATDIPETDTPATDTPATDPAIDPATGDAAEDAVETPAVETPAADAPAAVEGTAPEGAAEGAATEGTDTEGAGDAGAEEPEADQPPLSL
ncbi:MAG: hypothetical protein ACI89L_001296 [Phycisphaerales bacterium]|jgi:hypothetical protein